MDAIRLNQPRRVETTAELRCTHCGALVYLEAVIDRDGTPVERHVTGTYRQALDPDGHPVGPVIPYCTKEH